MAKSTKSSSQVLQNSLITLLDVYLECKQNELGPSVPSSVVTCTTLAENVDCQA